MLRFPCDPDIPSLTCCTNLQSVVLHTTSTFGHNGSPSWVPSIDLLWELPPHIRRLSLVIGPFAAFMLVPLNSKAVNNFLGRLDWSLIEHALKHCSRLEAVDITVRLASMDLRGELSRKIDLEGTATGEHILKSFSPQFRTHVRFG